VERINDHFLQKVIQTYYYSEFFNWSNSQMNVADQPYNSVLIIKRLLLNAVAGVVPDNTALT